jgi:nucleoside-diphosphate-sugar epimerase
MELLSPDTLPARIEDEAALEELLSRPSAGLLDDLRHIDGDVLILGIGGKIGPTLARMLKRAAPDRRVVGVARFSDPALRARLEGWGIETLPADLLDREAVQRLPRLPNVIFMAGRKFGTMEEPPFAWAMNTYVPSLVADTFRTSRIVAYSTLCVYPFAPAPGAGWDEAVPPAPPGEYANSCVGRERIFQYFSGRHGNPGRQVRLNYAIDLRYGIVHDVARWVLEGRPVPLEMGYANLIWQGDANDHILRSLRHCTAPASPLNIGGAANTSIRELALAAGRRLGREPAFQGTEAPDAWINSTAEACRLFGPPQVPLERMLDWVCDWMQRGGPQHGKPTCYERRDGRF